MGRLTSPISFYVLRPKGRKVQGERVPPSRGRSGTGEGERGPGRENGDRGGRSGTEEGEQGPDPFLRGGSTSSRPGPEERCPLRIPNPLEVCDGAVARAAN